MRRRIGRRSLFFAAAALVCVLLVPATPPELRLVPWVTAALGAFWAILFAAEDLSAPREERRKEPPQPPESPFAPPPPP